MADGADLETQISPNTSGLEGLTDAQRARAQTRYQILQAYLEDGVPLSIVARQRGLPRRTLTRWVQRYRAYGLSGLCRNEHRKPAQSRLPHGLKRLVEGLALQRPRLSAAAIHRHVLDHAAEQGWPCPSYSMVYALIRGLSPALVKMAHEGTKEFSDTYDLLYRREAAAPNAIWQADHTQLDVWVLDEHQKPRRPWLTVVMDDYSRVIAGYLLSFNAPSAMQTALALRQAIWRKAQPDWQVCGLPEMLYTDHGSDFTSQHIEQVAAELKIRLVFSAVGRPRGRGKIERFFATVNQMFLSRLPACVRLSSAKKAIIPLSRLAEEFEAWLLRDYHRKRHVATKQAPQQRWQADGFLPRMPDSLEQLDLLLLTVPKTRRVQQDGVHFMGFRYISPTLAAYVGEQVLLRYDPRDMAEVRLFHKDRFLCRAICQELAGATVPLREIVQARNSYRRQIRQELIDRRQAVDSLIEARKWAEPVESPTPEIERRPAKPKLKRYYNE